MQITKSKRIIIIYSLVIRFNYAKKLSKNHKSYQNLIKTVKKQEI